MVSLARHLSGILTVSAFLLVMGGSSNSDPTTKRATLIYKHHSSEKVQGCYRQNENLALCFNIQEAFIELSSGENNTLVRFSELRNKMFVFQILDDAFVGNNRSSKVPMHLQYVPRKHRILREDDWKRMYDSEHNPNVTTQAFASKFNSALRRLRITKEITLLHALWTALRENAGNHLIPMRFHVLCMTLLPENGHRETAVPKSRWSQKVVGETTEEKTGGSMELKGIESTSTRKKKNIFRSKRSSRENCVDLRPDPNRDDCLGMCGPGCSCWSFVCGNCCYNQLCFEHDKCCRHNMLSLSCLLPFVYHLSCEGGFGGYPGCLT